MSEPIDPLLQEALPRRKTITLASGPVVVRELQMEEYEAYREALSNSGKGNAKRTDALAMLFSMAVIKEDGTPRFGLDQATQLAKSARVAAPIVAAILEVSGLADAKKG